MIYINLVTEDELSETLLKILINNLNRKFQVGHCFPDLKRVRAAGGASYIRKRISSFNMASKGTPFLVLTDLDSGECAPSLIKEWLPQPKHPNLLFRVAVREIEAWIMASRQSLARFLGIRETRIPLDIDNSIENPKEFLISLASQSRKKSIKVSLLPKPGSTAKVGRDYNGTLSDFLQRHWDLEEAMKHSDSLKRTFAALKQFRVSR